MESKICDTERERMELGSSSPAPSSPGWRPRVYTFDKCTLGPPADVQGQQVVTSKFGGTGVSATLGATDLAMTFGNTDLDQPPVPQGNCNINLDWHDFWGVFSCTPLLSPVPRDLAQIVRGQSAPHTRDMCGVMLGGCPAHPATSTDSHGYQQPRVPPTTGTPGHE